MTVTETIIKIDTVIKYVPDTFVIRQVQEIDSIIYHQDTLTVENDVSVAKTFWNPEVRKLEINLKGKVIDVPVQIDAKVKEKVKEVTGMKWYVYFFFGMLITVILILLIKIFLK